VLYFTSKTNLPLEDYRNSLHDKYNRNYVEDNSFAFSPHITFLRIKDSKVFEEHRECIENIINKEIQTISNLDINSGNIFLYAVNSQFKEEIQVKL
jgi:2'-5' RNA ligase